MINSNTDPHHRSLKDALAEALPVGIAFCVRYIHTRPRRCQPLFSPLANASSEKTTLTCHFLTVSIAQASQDVLVYAIEVLVYTTARLTTLFVSKADSTGYLRHSRPSPIKLISTTFLQWLSARHSEQRPTSKQVISLFGRAQGQYLFPGSADNTTKHVLDDRQLIKWWVRVLDPILCESQSNEAAKRAFITVPGYHGVELRQFLPQTRDRWSAGHPLRELALLREIPEWAPTRCLLPRFPDDPKARFMQDLDDEVGLAEDAGALASTIASPAKRKDGRWKSIHNLDRFWEAMEFRQECSSGRAVGFLWLVTDYDNLDSGVSQTEEEPSQSTASELQSSQHSALECQDCGCGGKRKKRKNRKLTGIIVARAPHIKGSSTTGNNTSSINRFDGNGICLTSVGYDQAMQTLLHLDFASTAVATRSTSKWVAEVASISRLDKQTWTLDVQGTASTTEPVTTHSMTPQINDLGSMIRKKKRPLDTTDSQQDTNASLQEQSVNVLGASFIRKKPKATV